MTGNEVIVFVVFALLGYWLVSFFLQRRSKPWPEILSIDANASVDEIRTAYQALSSQYGPDERKSKEIAAAYREAMRSRGMSA
jgi:preprotein translocase subunit Sec63